MSPLFWAVVAIFAGKALKGKSPRKPKMLRSQSFANWTKTSLCINLNCSSATFSIICLKIVMSGIFFAAFVWKLSSFTLPLTLHRDQLKTNCTVWSYSSFSLKLRLEIFRIKRQPSKSQYSFSPTNQKDQSKVKIAPRSRSCQLCSGRMKLWEAILLLNQQRITS